MTGNRSTIQSSGTCHHTGSNRGILHWDDLCTGNLNGEQKPQYNKTASDADCVYGVPMRFSCYQPAKQRKYGEHDNRCGNGNERKQRVPDHLLFSSSFRFCSIASSWETVSALISSCSIMEAKTPRRLCVPFIFPVASAMRRERNCVCVMAGA